MGFLLFSQVVGAIKASGLLNTAGGDDYLDIWVHFDMHNIKIFSNFVLIN